MGRILFPEKRAKQILIISAATFVMILGAFMIFHYVPSPPVVDMKYARIYLIVAGKNEAEKYSGDLYSRSKMCYDSAMKIWGSENDRFIYSRKYNKVEELARRATKMASDASENSIAIRSELMKRLAERIDSLNDLIIRINDQYPNYPFTPEIRERISKGKMLLKDSETSFEGRRYIEAEKSVTESEALLMASYNFADVNLRKYFTSYPLWKRWVDNTIAASKRNKDYSIIVDKFSRKLFIYHNGRKTYEFSAELGRNWVGTKIVKGDKATPEGIYKITKKLDGGRTKYYKALLINYPNAEDTARFKTEVRKGSLPATANIGGLIEIHGNGGKGVDWTDGCIALTDSEMDTVFKYARVGTPVTIVGSMKTFGDVLNR